MNQAAQAFAKQRRAIQHRRGFPWLLMSPTVVVLALLGPFPFIYAIRIAAFNISISKPYLPQLSLAAALAVLIFLRVGGTYEAERKSRHRDRRGTGHR
jgi:hypothetical protein